MLIDINIIIVTISLLYYIKTLIFWFHIFYRHRHLANGTYIFMFYILYLNINRNRSNIRALC